MAALDATSGDGWTWSSVGSKSFGMYSKGNVGILSILLGRVPDHGQHTVEPLHVGTQAVAFLRPTTDSIALMRCRSKNVQPSGA